ncbi:uncharacterized protein BYT42DRAFT_596011 [Radiomyces spectabilis]|uniref:uncharacterized protein n=1 Tax=Radiomyces spectabilis TaxID=64574 RepID=UPI00221F0F2E|nr:uncharacterized protein BYT42DRAFT_596011 [Radiomyces spectabilis]KAI8365170.1 hypothetical protein BYT42DRAFT_596011 [Radiomyces spectabilis]
MALPRPDIGRLQYQNIQFQIVDQEPIARQKETNIRSNQLGLVEDRELCPGTYTLFLTYLEDDKGTTSVRPSTVSNWVKFIMKNGGIKGVYKAHSIRSVSSTKAVEKLHSIEEVKQHANWSNRSNAFERGIVVGTTNNATLDETKATNVVHPPEWYQMFVKKYLR